MTALLTRPPAKGEIVFVATPRPEDASAEALRQRLAGHVPAVSDPSQYAALRDRIWGIVTWGGPPVLPRLVAEHGAPPRLAWLHQSGIGLEAIAGLPLPPEVLATSIRGNSYYAIPMAEHVVARMLEWAKRLPEHWAHQAARRWQQFDPPTLAGKTAMVFGYGTIAREVIKRLVAFDMEIVVVRRRISGDRVDGFRQLDLATGSREIGLADHVVLTLPLTAETRGFLGRAELGRMKPSAFIVNVGRAGLIDEAALADAMRAGTIGGAALDVFWREPLAPDDDVWAWPRTAITPHMSANIEGGNADIIAGTAVETLAAILGGKPLDNRVDLAAGY